MAARPEFTDEQQRVIADYANRLPEVLWDRFTCHETDGQLVVSMYGWIAREDGRSDFVLLQWWDLSQDPVPWSITSSSVHSWEIGRRLYSEQDWWKPDIHVDCERVDEQLPSVENAAHVS